MISLNTMTTAEIRNHFNKELLVLPITDYSSLQEANDIILSCVSYFLNLAYLDFSDLI